MKMDRERLGDLAARAVVSGLLLILSINIFKEFLRTGHLTGLLWLTSESLVIVLTVVRRRARRVDRSWVAAVVTGLSFIGPFVVRPSAGEPLAPDALTAIVSALGLTVVIVGKLALGRSFGLVPANRGIVVGGPYNLVRHPIYSGYLISHAAFLVAHPHAWNITVLLASDAALIVRALLEERVLSADADYKAYCRRVGWHLMPGVF
jgi:protein-S-isoprenylcysteine O-methyltransferase Ste14